MSQHFVYHWIPKNMKGTILYPLNQLKEIEPELYDEHAKKYVGRETLMERKIPLLDCLWNDVLHTTAIDPVLIYEKLREAGFDYPPKKFFKIPIEMLDQSKLAIYLFKEVEVGKPGLFQEFDTNKFDEYTIFDQRTLEYYKEMKAQDKHPLVHHLLPHVLYKGQIDTTGLEIIEA